MSWTIVAGTWGLRWWKARGLKRVPSFAVGAAASLNYPAVMPAPGVLGHLAWGGCGPGSPYDQYLEMLGYVCTYLPEGDKLVLNMRADGGDPTNG